MSLIVRKIERAKWMQNDILSGADVSADAITNCMKTTINSLSVWEVSQEDKVEDAVLALASQSERIETMDVVILNRTRLIEVGLQLEETNGLTPIEALSQKHRDIVYLTYTSLGVLARLIVEGIRNNTVQRYTVGRIKNLIKNAIAAGRLNEEALKEKVRSQLCKTMT